MRETTGMETDRVDELGDIQLFCVSKVVYLSSVCAENLDRAF